MEDRCWRWKVGRWEARGWRDRWWWARHAYTQKILRKDKGKLTMKNNKNSRSKLNYKISTCLGEEEVEQNWEAVLPYQVCTKSHYQTGVSCQWKQMNIYRVHTVGIVITHGGPPIGGGGPPIPGGGGPPIRGG